MNLDLFGDQTKHGLTCEELAIERLRTFEPPEGFILAYSGGKDSDVLLSLARAAGVRYDAHYHATTIDPPEVVRHVKDQLDVTIDRPAESMARLIGRWGLPSRWRRWCCSALKERPWPGRVVLTGVRWAESPRRAGRRMVEPARSGKGQMFLHPIIDWSDADLWGHIRSHGFDLVSLYGERMANGKPRSRVGCVCCPLNPRPEDAERWPHIAEAMHRAWLRFVAARRQDWTVDEAETIWQRWLKTGMVTPGEPEVDDGCPLFADARDATEADAWRAWE